MCRPTWPPSGQHSTEASKVRTWLARCPRWHVHFTPPMPPASIRSNASSRSSTNAPIRHGRRRKNKRQLSPRLRFHAPSCGPLVPTPPCSTSRDFVGELPGRNCVAGMKTEERKAGGDLWLNGPTSGECAYVHRRQLLLDRHRERHWLCGRRHREQAGLAVSSVANHCPVCDRDASAVSYEILTASAAPFLDTHSTSIQDRWGLAQTLLLKCVVKADC